MAKLPANAPIEDFDKVIISKEDYRQLVKDSTLLKAVRDSGVFETKLGEVIMRIANLEHKYHLL